MPPRSSRAAARRAWGTRFDSLPASASASAVSEDATASEIMGPDGRDTSVAFSEPDGTRSEVDTTVSESSVASHRESASARQDIGWEGRNTDHDPKASWGDADQYPTIAPPADVGYSRIPRPRPLQRWDHNASVFVASLPPMPNAELDSLLRGSLGNHGSIINIKFIHDVKSGNAANCAFVQFETPEQARAAIQACHMSFIQGRCIRCEPAKAHRTLLVSFRPLFLAAANPSSPVPTLRLTL
ncbi:hypothetical protein BS47DRAFT_1068769 [Hydnum rufescens UP504]|uniref:RRM domain-containing protein n=1 Tax=Hydnum rufescens UP504 TaxID=1448309 RepID=A0A9P6AUV4_9AGAM|nr:hypothetical protein BS47DRAFT_1068769 [Hydnum rufescens UP504]